MDLNSFGIAVGRIPLLAEEHGTPLYIYSERILQERYLAVYKALNGLFLPQVNYAVMANNRKPVLETLGRLGAAAQVNSVHEYELAQQVFKKNRHAITIATTNISDEDFDKYGEKPYLYLDSLSEIERYGKRNRKCREIGIRVRVPAPVFSVATTNQSILPRIGIQPTDFDKVADVASRHNLKITGIHGYLASNVESIRPFVGLTETLLAYASAFPDVGLINLGGGFGIASLPGKSDFDFPSFVKQLASVLENFRTIHRRGFRMRFEPGRYLVGPAGIFVTRVTNRKIVDGVIYLGVDGSFGSFPRPYMYGVEGAGNHPVWPVAPRGGSLSHTHICGCSTLQNDFLAINRRLPPIEVGDLLVFGNSGAYCATLASGFPGQNKAKEVFVTKSGAVSVLPLPDD